jgi:predicted CXXCH cytochrome family protein
MTGRRLAGTLGCLLVLATAAASPANRPSAFPHAAHARLFTSCTACHDATEADTPGRLVTVTPADCARCHDGTSVPAVNWQPPPGPEAVNLVFSHQRHVGREKIACAACHAAPGTPGAAPGAGAAATAPRADAPRMTDMVRPTAETCLACHQATGHLAADAVCSRCHESLASAPALTAERIAAFPHPPNHEAPDFLATHGALAGTDLARCAVCHARETCDACHLAGDRLDPVRAMAADARVLPQRERITPRWPRPAGHDTHDWLLQHGRAAEKDNDSCAQCHRQSSCTECHGDAPAVRAVIGRLTADAAPGPSGVTRRAGRPPFHPPGFRLAHGNAAASKANCASCHATESFCSACHEGTVASGFHPPGYLNRHAADAYARDLDCAGCHSNEVSCRSCHENAGLAGFESTTSSYHDAQPFWLLAHGQAARQGMDTCASCHAQTDCLQCHSARSGWRINPHGDGFEAERLSDRGPAMCALCHVSNPVPESGRERTVPR